MSQSIAENYARFVLDKVVHLEAGDFYHPQVLQNIVEAFRFQAENVDNNPHFIPDDNFEDLAREYVVDPARMGNRVAVLQGMLPERILIRIPYWQKFQELREYLRTIGLDCMVLFQADLYKSEIGGLYPVEFRIYPIVRVEI